MNDETQGPMFAWLEIAAGIIDGLVTGSVLRSKALAELIPRALRRRCPFVRYFCTDTRETDCHRVPENDGV